MDIRDHLLYMVKTNQAVLKRLLDDVTPEDSMVRGEEQLNHICWLTGHLLNTNGYALSLTGATIEDYPEWGKIFDGGSEISDDQSVYPPWADLRERLFRIYEQMTSAYSRLSDDDLGKMVGDDQSKAPLWQRLSFLCMHDFYHAGQIVYMRKILGRKRPFG